MPRTLRPDVITGYSLHMTNVTLLATNAVTDATIALAGILAPNPGARVVKWWIRKVTAGTGTGDITAYLVVNGGTSSTRQVSSAIVVDTDAASGTVTEGKGWAGGMYEIAAADAHLACDLVYTLNTTNTNAPAGFTVGVVWSV